MRFFFLSLIGSLLCISALGQKQQSFKITGKILVIIGNVTMPAGDLFLKLNNTNYYSDTNNDGGFAFTNVSPGRYHLILINSDFAYLDTLISVTRDVHLKFTLKSHCEVNNITALNDVKQHQVKLLLISGIAGPHITVGDNTFQKKYGINYFDYGCTPPNRNCVLAYNKYIFSHLDKKYGLGWRKNVRKDVVGLLQTD
jgi:hypothetical protein